MTEEPICPDCGFDGDYHSDEGKCMNAHARYELRHRKGKQGRMSEGERPGDVEQALAEAEQERTTNSGELPIWISRRGVIALAAALKAERERVKACHESHERDARLSAERNDQLNELKPRADKLRAGLISCLDALGRLRQAVKAEPVMNNRKYDDLGFVVNSALTAAQALIEEKS